MDESTHLKLPYIMPSQGLKHITHNEALARLDALVHLAVLDRDLAAPPGSPLEGDRYIVAGGATGAWSGWSGDIACFVGGAWLRLVPRAGWVAFVGDEASLLYWSGGWQDLGTTLTAGTTRILAAGGGNLSHTGSTAETVVKSVALPANAMGPNGLLKISSIWSNNNSANNKTFRLRLGASGHGTAGTVAFTAAATTNLSYNDPERLIVNGGAANAQIGRNAGTAGAGGSPSSVFTATVDTSAATDLNFTVELANVADTAALRAFCVEVLHGA